MLRWLSKKKICMTSHYYSIGPLLIVRRIGALNFTNMNLSFVVIKVLIVCLSIAGRTTQGDNGSGMLCTTYLELGVPLGNRYLNYWINVVTSANDKILCHIVVCL